MEGNHGARYFEPDQGEAAAFNHTRQGAFGPFVGDRLGGGDIGLAARTSQRG